MPTYGYRCEKCGAEFDVFQRMTDDPVADCPTCGGPGKRLFFPAGIVFKGTGFYKTDSRGSSSSSISGGSSSSSSGSSSSSSTSSGSSDSSSSSSKPATSGTDG